jgi:hypothetical protein
MKTEKLPKKWQEKFRQESKSRPLCTANDDQEANGVSSSLPIFELVFSIPQSLARAVRSKLHRAAFSIPRLRCLPIYPSPSLSSIYNLQSEIK